MHFVSELIQLLLLHRGVSLKFAKDWAFSRSWFWDKPCWHLLSIHACMYSFAQVSRTAMLLPFVMAWHTVTRSGKNIGSSWCLGLPRLQIISDYLPGTASRAVLWAPALWPLIWFRPLSPRHSGYVSKLSDGVCSIAVPPLWTGAYVHSYSIPSYSMFSFTLLVIKSSAPNTIVQSVPKTGSPPWLAQCFSEATFLPHTRPQSYHCLLSAQSQSPNP